MNESDWFAEETGAGALKARKASSWRVKAGFDPTAPDLHLGHAALLARLRRLQDMNHEVLMVVGDFTASVGDPSGRNKARPALSGVQIKENAATYMSQAFLILDSAKTKVEENSSWLGALGADGLLALASRQTLARTLEREDFRTRLKENNPLGLNELLYPLLQGFDSVHLKCDAEAGGIDQKLNLHAGRDLMRSMDQEPQACLMSPLLLGLDGVKKMSKSLGNHIGLTESASEIFGKTMSISDETMLNWIEVLAPLWGETPKDAQGRIGAIKAGSIHPMEMKKDLAMRIISALQGPEAAPRARLGFEKAFGEKDKSHEAPETMLLWRSEPWMWRQALKELGFARSFSGADRLIKAGALRVDGEKQLDPRSEIPWGFEGVVSCGKISRAKLICAKEAPNQPGALLPKP